MYEVIGLQYTALCENEKNEKNQQNTRTPPSKSECLWMMPSISPLITCKTLHCCAPSVTSTQNKDNQRSTLRTQVQPALLNSQNPVPESRKFAIVRTQKYRLEAEKFPMFLGGWILPGFFAIWISTGLSSGLSP